MTRTAPAIPDLAQDVQALFAAPVAVAVTDPAADHRTGHASETATIVCANDKRRREFLAGRTAARRAMHQLGLAEQPVPMADDRAPIWPEGLVGSISHSDTLCLAALAARRDVPAIGLDIEPATSLAPDLIPEICTWSERAWLSRQPRNRRGQMAKLIFSAKECAYKCQYPTSGALLEFHDLEVTADSETGQFEATFQKDVAGFDRGARLCGRWQVVQGHIITAIAARAE